MPNLSIQNNDTGSVVLRNAEFRDDLLGGIAAADYPEGTILARITGSENLVEFVPGGALGTDIPVAVLTAPASIDGVTTIPVRVLVAGSVRDERLSIANATAIDDVIRDQLRDTSIIPITVTELNQLDNQ